MTTEELIKEKGFKDFQEFVYLVQLLNTKVNKDVFDDWKKNDGTKDMLLYLIGEGTIN